MGTVGPQVELDLFQDALQAKAAMWDVVAELADHTSELIRIEMERLYKVRGINRPRCTGTPSRPWSPVSSAARTDSRRR